MHFGIDCAPRKIKASAGRLPALHASLRCCRLKQRLPVLRRARLIAGVSLRASIEFLRAAPEAARVLSSDELSAWGEIGRRLAMSDAESAVALFNDGVAALAHIPARARTLIFQICERQMTLSSSVAIETFRRAPLLALNIKNPEMLSLDL